MVAKQLLESFSFLHGLNRGESTSRFEYCQINYF